MSRCNYISAVEIFIASLKLMPEKLVILVHKSCADLAWEARVNGTCTDATGYSKSSGHGSPSRIPK